MNYTRSAIVLSNAGVCLLERSCHAQAVDVFRDAVSILRSSLHNGNETASSSSNHHSMMFDMHKRAMEYLANPRPNQSSLRVETVSSEILYTKANCVIEQELNVREAFPVRIEASHQPANQAIVSAIILYNFAIARLCLASVMDQSRSNHLVAAKKLFSASYMILQAHVAECLGSDSLICPFLSLEVLVLTKLLAVLMELNETDQVKALQDGYTLLVHAMRSLDSFERCFHQQKHAAAAA